MSEENIRVSVRVRPLNKRENDGNERSGWRVVDGASIVPTENNPRPGQGFSFGSLQPFAFPPRIALRKE
jgi:hypothetical protein